MSVTAVKMDDFDRRPFFFKIYGLYANLLSQMFVYLAGHSLHTAYCILKESIRSIEMCGKEPTV